MKVKNPRITSAYEIVTEASAANGEAEERGWLNEHGVEIEGDEEMSLADLAVEYLQSKGAIHPSSSHFCPGVWYSTEEEMNMRTGEVETTSYFLEDFPWEVEEEIFKRITK